MKNDRSISVTGKATQGNKVSAYSHAYLKAYAIVEIAPIASSLYITWNQM